MSGSVLLIVLWLLMAMSLLCITFARTVRIEATVISNDRMMASANYLAQAGISEAIYQLVSYRLDSPRTSDSDAELEPLEIDTGTIVRDYDIGRVTVEILDENGKVNINTADKNILTNLLLAVGASEIQANTISDSIIDWRDPDNEPLLDGAEAAYYQSLSPSYLPRNANFETTEELLLVRGVDPALYFGFSTQSEMGHTSFRTGLNRCTTVYGAMGGVNVNTAPLHVLMAIGFPPETAEAIVRERKIKRFKDILDVSSRVPKMPGQDVLKTGISTQTTYKFSYYTLIATATIRNTHLKKTIMAIVRLNHRYQQKYGIVYWNENFFLDQQD